MSCIGIDLHQDRFNICGIDGAGERFYKHYWISETGMQDFRNILNQHDEIAVEATGNTSWFCSQLQGNVSRIAVVNGRRFVEIRKSLKKNDKQDAIALAENLKTDTLPECRLRSLEQENLFSLLKTRQTLVKHGTACKNKIHALHVANGKKLKKKGLNSCKKLRALDLSKFSESVRFEIEELRDEVISIHKKLYRFKLQIKKLAQTFPGYESIISITGIGIISAAVLLAFIGDINDFSSAKKLTAYAGLVPWLSQSNGRLHLGKITKCGDKLVRSTLVQCGLVAKRFCPGLQIFHDDLKRRRGSGKANVALARKMLTIIYHTLKKEWVFLDFPNGVKA